jgi:hypothetical protein
MQQPEKYYAPKELASELEEKHGFTVTVDTLRTIRRASAGDGLFVAGTARASEVLNWLRAHPDLRRHQRGGRVSAGFAL